MVITPLEWYATSLALCYCFSFLYISVCCSLNMADLLQVCNNQQIIGQAEEFGVGVCNDLHLFSCFSFFLIMSRMLLDVDSIWQAEIYSTQKMAS